MQPMRLAVSGKMASGKDTVAMRAIAQLGLPAHRVNIADAIRARLQTVYDLGRADPEKIRQHLSDWSGLPEDDDIIEQIVRVAHGGQDANSRTAGNRIALQQLALLGRRRQPGMWREAHLAAVEASEKDGVVTVTTDVREPDEVRALKAAGFILVRLVVDETTQLRRLRQRDGLAPDHSLHHPNETALDSVDDRTDRELADMFDLIVTNDGTAAKAARKVADLLADRWKV